MKDIYGINIAHDEIISSKIEWVESNKGGTFAKGNLIRVRGKEKYQSKEMEQNNLFVPPSFCDYPIADTTKKDMLSAELTEYFQLMFSQVKKTAESCVVYVPLPIGQAWENEKEAYRELLINALSKQNIVRVDEVEIMDVIPAIISNSCVENRKLIINIGDYWTEYVCCENSSIQKRILVSFGSVHIKEFVGGKSASIRINNYECNNSFSIWRTEEYSSWSELFKRNTETVKKIFGQVDSAYCTCTTTAKGLIPTSINGMNIHILSDKSKLIAEYASGVAMDLETIQTQVVEEVKKKNTDKTSPKKSSIFDL